MSLTKVHLALKEGKFRKKKGKYQILTKCLNASLIAFFLSLTDLHPIPSDNMSLDVTRKGSKKLLRRGMSTVSTTSDKAGKEDVSQIFCASEDVKIP